MLQVSLICITKTGSKLINWLGNAKVTEVTLWVSVCSGHDTVGTGSAVKRCLCHKITDQNILLLHVH